MRILLVEDERDVRLFLLRALTLLMPEVEVVPAADGHEALESFARESFDLVLSDQRMPRMTGIELLRAVRSCSEVPFLMLSADRGAEVDALAAGVNEFLIKPVQLITLHGAVDRYRK